MDVSLGQLSSLRCAVRHFRMPPELVNLQVERGQAKRYQVRQVARLVRRYDLPLEDER